MFFFIFIKKNIKNMHKNIKLQYPFHSNKKHRQYCQYESNKSIIMQQNTRAVQEMESLPMRNASYL